MKKLMFLFGVLTFMSLGFISCSDDDDGSSDGPNRNLNGTWKTDYRVVDGTYQEGSQSCDQKFEYNFYRNGEYTLKSFTGDDSENCLENAEVFGTWSYLGDNKYLIHENTITITDENKDMYTFHLDFRSDNELRMYSIADHNSSANTFTVLKKL